MYGVLVALKKEKNAIIVECASVMLCSLLLGWVFGVICGGGIPGLWCGYGTTTIVLTIWDTLVVFRWTDWKEFPRVDTLVSYHADDEFYGKEYYEVLNE